MRIGSGPSILLPACSGKFYSALLQSRLDDVANNKRPCIFWHRADVTLKVPLLYSPVETYSAVPLAMTNPLAFYKVVEQSSRLAYSSDGELCGPSSALGYLLYIPGLLSGDLYQKLIPSWDHSKAYMSALATSVKVRISAAQRLQEKGGETWGGEARVAGRGTEHEDLEGVEVPGSARAITALGLGLLDLLEWSAGEAGSTNSSSGNVGNVGNAVTTSVGGFGAPEQLFAPPSIQLVVLLWAARGLAVVGPLLLSFPDMEEDAEVAAIFEGVLNERRSTRRSSSNNIEGIGESGKAVEDDVSNNSSSSGGSNGSNGSSSSGRSSSSSGGSSVYGQGSVKRCSSSETGQSGSSSSCMGDESDGELVLLDVLEDLKPLDLLRDTSLHLIQAMDNWQSAAWCSTTGAGPSVGTGHCLSSAASAAGLSSSSAEEAEAAASNTADAAAAAAVPPSGEKGLRSLGAAPSSSSSSNSAGEAMPAAMALAAAAAQPIVSGHGLGSTSTAQDSSSSSSPHAAAAVAAPTSHGLIPKRLAKLPRSGLPAAVVDQLNLVMSKWDLRYHCSCDGRLHIDLCEELSRDQEVEFVGDVVSLAGVLLAEVHTPVGCSNPHCVNLAWPSEIQLAGKSCKGCKVVYYCSKECQTTHWGTHKPQCKKLKQQQGDKQQGGAQGEQGTQ